MTDIPAHYNWKSKSLFSYYSTYYQNILYQGSEVSYKNIVELGKKMCNTATRPVNTTCDYSLINSQYGTMALQMV